MAFDCINLGNMIVDNKIQRIREMLMYSRSFILDEEPGPDVASESESEESESDSEAEGKQNLPPQRKVLDKFDSETESEVSGGVNASGTQL